MTLRDHHGADLYTAIAQGEPVNLSKFHRASVGSRCLQSGGAFECTLHEADLFGEQVATNEELGRGGQPPMPRAVQAPSRPQSTRDRRPSRQNARNFHAARTTVAPFVRADEIKDSVTLGLLFIDIRFEPAIRLIGTVEFLMQPEGDRS